MDFEQIQVAVKKNDKKLDYKPFFDTKKGIWGPSSIIDCYELFKTIKLENYKHLVDLGSGDGRIIAVAGLFTKATGIEFDEKLHTIAQEMKQELNNPQNITFIKEDFMETDFSQFDCIFAFYDKFFSPQLELKIKKEFTGDIYLYENVFKPQALTFVKIIWIHQLPIYMYTTKTN